ncbi:AMP-dependent synthetase and ligase [Phenylobacterium zucineum HLK1]|uniref:AMP-dependent synthetase and ligase n=1 Tax=Phenylobacterium zucineum (strain HLK1) TaxID=450851 RepID=B4RGN4_PHEZH|nr:fatty acid--CoA ligase family protein [Phenylobacterium zucineum]ACG78940.1 AMP-dependent synthetase and ligase [Phenylobacterium zucineum HLK1]
MNLAQLVRGVLQLQPDAEAIEHGGSWWTWSDLEQVIDRLDAMLNEAGLGAGVRVGGLLRNTSSIAAGIIGLVITDRCVVTLTPMLPDERLSADILALRPPAILGCAEDWARPAILAAAREIGCLGLELTGDRSDPVRLVPGLETVAGSDLRRDAPGIAVEMLTSGTTGAPKRVPLKARTLEQAVIDAGVYDNRRPDDPPKLRGGVQILNAPFAHISGVFGLFNCVAAGRKSCLLGRFTVESWVDAVRRHRPKVAGAPPSALRMILDADVPKEDLSSLVAFRAGTAPLDPDLGDAFFERYGIPVLQNYGATEFAGGVAGWTLADFKAHHKDKRGSVGRMNPGCHARIVDPETGEILPFGTEGLLELKADHLGDGDWFRTTDLAVLDPDNFLWIKGRFDNAIIRGGFKVFPDDVVRALEQHPSIREAAVVDVPDPRLGQVPVAAYIVKSGASAPAEEELRAFLRERLLPYQVPAQLKALQEMPRTPSLKVSQPELRKLFTGPLAA